MIKFAIKIQDFLKLLILTKISIIRVCLLSKFWQKNPKSNIFNESVILGNGPSLTKSIQDYKSFFESKDLFVVNLFANSSYFEELKPRFYVIVAPEIWSDNPSETIAKMRTELFENIVKATWEIIFYIPHFAKKYAYWKQFIESKPNFKIIYFNPTPIEGFKSWNSFFYNRNLGMPRPHNVFTPSLMVAISQNYSRIYLLGADHSWLTDIWVSKNNEVFLTQKHFYDEATAKPNFMYSVNAEPRKLHEVLHKFMCAFSSYFEIRRYAESKNIRILNATPDSYIDAFERIDLENL